MVRDKGVFVPFSVGEYRALTTLAYPEDLS
jgi:hypothetical protein